MSPKNPLSKHSLHTTDKWDFSFRRQIYNDLKPQNIMVEKDEEGKLHIVLIDFGFSAKYITPEGCHISGEELKDSF